MTLRDIVSMATHNLWQRRMRTLLNLSGVVTGCVVLLMTAAGSTGVKDAIHLLFDSTEFARQIYVYPVGVRGEPPADLIVVEGAMDDSRRERLKKALSNEWVHQQYQDQPHEITQSDLRTIRAMPHVVDVLPTISVGCTVAAHDHPVSVSLTGVNLHSNVPSRSLVAGTVISPDDRDGILLDEFTAYKLGFRSDTELQQLIGQPVTIEYRVVADRVAGIFSMLSNSWGDTSIENLTRQGEFFLVLRQLMNDLDLTTLNDEQKQLLRSLVAGGARPETPESAPVARRTFSVRGVTHGEYEDPAAALFRSWFHRDRAALRIHPAVAEEIWLSLPEIDSFSNALVLVDSSSRLQPVSEDLSDLGMSCNSSQYFLDSIDDQISRSAWVVYGIAAAVLITSAIGISNTLILSVLERTPEFGILKSIGARDGLLMKLMMVEGGLLGLLGAAAATVISLVLGIIGRGLLRSYVESRTLSALPGSLFQFSAISIVGVTGIAILICVLASLLPAWRAARLDPVVAMRRT